MCRQVCGIQLDKSHSLTNLIGAVSTRGTVFRLSTSGTRMLCIYHQHLHTQQKLPSLWASQQGRLCQFSMGLKLGCLTLPCPCQKHTYQLKTSVSQGVLRSPRPLWTWKSYLTFLSFSSSSVDGRMAWELWRQSAESLRVVGAVAMCARHRWAFWPHCSTPWDCKCRTEGLACLSFTHYYPCFVDVETCYRGKIERLFS